ncbi:hypothetical protein AVEN_117692-1 [Araneus ventricosus]|uniref:Tc1-like transposase DDE domain-containing protein n=1 Tax=Araneus ventricosus TaxID=182803 RepID=A0A4Y2P692_ARAVE|nr:hypothetical protein AVEN_117692-1 [Araneus ventricosus]
MFPYKIQSHQAIPIKAVRQRFDFANEILTMIDNEGFDVGCIWFTDEAHFHLNGFVNKQNWRFRGSENPHLCEEKPLHSPKLLLGLRYAAKALSALFSCEKRSLVNVTLQFWNNLSAHRLALEDRPRIEWFMQDGARPHHTEIVFRFLDKYFGNRVIALDFPKFSAQEWADLHIRRSDSL